jgi:hypothetical protein
MTQPRVTLVAQPYRLVGDAKVHGTRDGSECSAAVFGDLYENFRRKPG